MAQTWQHRPSGCRPVSHLHTPMTPGRPFSPMHIQHVPKLLSRVTSYWYSPFHSTATHPEITLHPHAFAWCHSLACSCLHHRSQSFPYVQSVTAATATMRRSVVTSPSSSFAHWHHQPNLYDHDPSSSPKCLFLPTYSGKLRLQLSDSFCTRRTPRWLPPSPCEPTDWTPSSLGWPTCMPIKNVKSMPPLTHQLPYAHSRSPSCPVAMAILGARKRTRFVVSHQA